MDMDSTAIQIECIDEIAKLAGVGEEVSEVTERAMRGELDFKASLRERVGKLKDTDVSVLETVRSSLPLMPGLTSLVRKLQSLDWHVAIASGGFTYLPITCAIVLIWWMRCLIIWKLRMVNLPAK